MSHSRREAVAASIFPTLLQIELMKSHSSEQLDSSSVLDKSTLAGADAIATYVCQGWTTNIRPEFGATGLMIRVGAVFERRYECTASTYGEDFDNNDWGNFHRNVLSNKVNQMLKSGKYSVLSIGFFFSNSKYSLLPEDVVICGMGKDGNRAMDFRPDVADIIESIHPSLFRSVYSDESVRDLLRGGYID